MSKKMTFEEAITLLEEKINDLESGTRTLDGSIAVFEEAVKLVKSCNKMLTNAEQKVKLLIENEDGSVTDEPFNTDNET